MGIVESLLEDTFELSEFQKKKLIHEFRCFYDVNGDGKLQWRDFDMAREHICKMSGWKVGTEKYKQAHDLFMDIWKNLQDIGDEDIDGAISEDEWLTLWTNIEKDVIEEKKRKELEEKKKKKEKEKEERVKDGKQETDIIESKEVGDKNDDNGVYDIKYPDWLEKYIVYKFNLYDRTGNGEIDVDEFEYVLSNFKIPAKDCRCAFMMFSQNGERKVTFAYFRRLALEYYRSDDPSALGNFINGRLSFDENDSQPK